MKNVIKSYPINIDESPDFIALMFIIELENAHYEKSDEEYRVKFYEYCDTISNFLLRRLPILNEQYLSKVAKSIESLLDFQEKETYRKVIFLNGDKETEYRAYKYINKTRGNFSRTIKNRLIRGGVSKKIADAFTTGEIDYSSKGKRNSKIKEPTSQKAQILILKQLGVFDNPKFENSTLEKKGEFLSMFLNMNFDNAKDYIGHIKHEKKQRGNIKSPYNETAIKQANDILKLIGLPQI